MLNPVFEVDWNGQRADAAVAGFRVETSAASADLAVLRLQDPEGALVPRMKRGDRIRIRVGYVDDRTLPEIFDGLIRSIEPRGLQTSVEALDWQAALQARRVVRTWEHAAPAEILTDLLGGTGLTLEATVPALELDRFPVHDLTIVQAIRQLLQRVEAETGAACRFFVRAGKLVVAPANEAQPAAAAFVTGETIVHQRPGKLGRQVLETLIAPVQHDQVVTIDGARWFVDEATWTWGTGGRLLLQVWPCATS